MKQLLTDPWDGVDAKYPAGGKFTGRVTNITDYGAFVELEPGVEGLVHVSEMSWTKKNLHPSKILSTSQEVDVQVLDVRASAGSGACRGRRRRVSLTGGVPRSRCHPAAYRPAELQSVAALVATIGAALAQRELMEHLRSFGEGGGGPKPFSAQDRSRFLSALDAAKGARSSHRHKSCTSRFGSCAGFHSFSRRSYAPGAGK